MVKRKGNKSNTKPKTKNKQYTVEQLIDRAEGCMERCEFDLAEKFYSRALEMEPRNCDILDTLGELLVDLGKPDKAKTLFEKSITIEPNVPTKYMSLGQLLDGEGAISYFRKGIEIMSNIRQELVSKKTDSGEVSEIEGQLSAACCTLAEVYLTDSCYDAAAEIECQKALDLAIRYTPQGPEVYYLLASLRISQQRNSEALEAINKGYSFWNNADTDADEPDLDNIPYQLRFNYSKIFVELEQYQKAIEILEVLVAEEDNIAEVWHTLGLAYQGINDLHSAHECLSLALQLFKQSGEAEQEVIQSLTILLAKVDSSISNLPEDTDENMDEQEENESDENK